MTTTRHAAATVRSDVVRLADDLAGLAEALRDGLTDEVQTRIDAVRARAAALGDCGALDESKALVREWPLLSLAASFVAGMVAGRVLGR